MDFDSIGAFAMFLSGGAIGLGLVLLSAYKAKLKAGMAQSQLGEASSESVDQLREEMQQSLSQQAAEIEDLNERLDFTERLLTKGTPRQVGKTTPIT